MYYFSKRLANSRILVLAPLSSRCLALAGGGEEISDESGYFLYERSGEDDCGMVSIIAQVHSDAAALALKTMIGLD